MKKKTNLQTATPRDADDQAGLLAAVGQPEARKHGPLKEKAQITLRIDQQLMNDAYAMMKEDNTRITDIVERGIHLAIRERNHDMSPYTKQIRFVLANVTREQQILMRGLAIAMVEGELEETQASVEISKIFEMVKWFLESRNRQPYATRALEYYSRYGKSAQEIAQLGKL